MKRAVSKTYTLWFSAVSLFILFTALLATGIVIWRSSSDLRERLRLGTQGNFEAIQHDAILSLTEFLRRELFTSLYNLDIENVDITIKELQHGMPVTSVRIADGTGMVLTDGTRDNPYYGTQLTLDQKRLEAEGIVIEQVPRGRRVTFRIAVPGYLAGYGEINFSDRQLRQAIEEQNQAILQILREYRERLLEIALVETCLIALLAVLVSVILSKTLSLPLVALRDAASRVAQGEFGHRVEVRASAEVGELAAAFNQMGAELQKRTEETARAYKVLQAEVEEHRKTEQALRSSEERLALARRAGKVAVYDWNPADGTGVFPGLEELFGLPPGSFTGSYQDWAQHVHPEDLPRIEGELRQRFEEQAASFESEYRILRGSGTTRWIAAAGQIFYRDDGAPSRMIGTLVDVTELKESQLAAMAANRAKSGFLANMSHEMRTPLAGTLGMINLVLEMEIGAEEREMLEMARRAAESLLRLISDLLDFSRLEAGVLTFERKPFLLPETVKSSLEVIALEAREKGLQVSWALDASVPETVLGDAGRLRQVLVNLLGNAVKFTRKGEVEVRVSTFCHLDAPHKDLLLFSVRDTGIGIPQDQRESIFGKFVQVNSTARRKYGGAGLGLALSREIVEFLGGRIWVESEVGKGSTFYFTYPLDGRPSGKEDER